jgi:2',3'-cyclic-nucleotide 2'-phosphodiesterase (5'-nucleotidase family)
MLRRSLTRLAPDTSNIRVRLACINDVYELENLPRLHSLLMNLKPRPNAVTLAGDFISPSTLSSIDGGRGMVKTLRACGITHVSLGNHEADVKQGVLRERLRELSKSVTVLNSNIGFRRRDAAEDWITEETSSHSIIQSHCKTVSVALFGLMSDEPDMFRDGTFKGLQISSVPGSFSALASDVKHRHEPQAFIPMTHMSLKRDQDLVKYIGKSLELDGKVPLIIGGHEVRLNRDESATDSEER